jgi:hypothetical protein
VVNFSCGYSVVFEPVTYRGTGTVLKLILLLFLIQKSSVADPGSGAFLTTGSKSRIRDSEWENNRIRDPG